MKKIYKSESAGTLMRHAVSCLLLVMGTLTSQAANGDQWEAPGVVTNHDGAVYCLFEVVSESNATVKYVKRGDKKCTLETLGGSDRFWMYDEVEHNGKTYRIVGIGEGAFSYMEGIQEVSLMSKDVKTIEMGAFRNCPVMYAINFGPEVESIGALAFYACRALDCTTNSGHYDSGIDLPAKLKSIGEEAFSGFAATSVTFPDGLTTIGNYAFNTCRGLTSASLPESVKSIGAAPFHCCTNMQNIYMDDNGVCYAKDGVLYKRENTEYGQRVCLVQFPCGRTSSYSIQDDVSIVGSYAFSYSNLGNVFLPETVVEIRDGAFANAPKLSMVYVEWYSVLPSIGINAFKKSADLSQNMLYIPNQATGMLQADIYNFYAGTELASYFDHIYHYTPFPVQGLRVGGSSVLRTMCTNMGSEYGITSGSATYEIGTKTLILDNATIETSYNDEFGVQNTGVEGLTIQLYGNNRIYTNAAGMVLKDENTITGPGKLSIVSNYEEAILVDHGWLDIIDTDLDLDSRGGALSGNTYAYVNVDNSRLYMKPTYSTGVATVNNISDLTLNNSHFSSPMFCSFKSSYESVVSYDDTPCYGYVVIAPGKAYDLYVGTQVTEENKDDISYYGFSRGHASYDPYGNVLTLDNVYVADNAGVLLSNVDDLTVNLIGENYLLSTEDAIWLLRDATFTGSGSLEVECDYGSAMKLENPDVRVDIINTNMNLHGVSGAIWGNTNEGQSVWITNSNVKLSSDGGKYKVCTMLAGLTLYDCEYKYDYFYFDADEQTLCDERYYGDPVYQDVVEIVATGKPTAITAPSVETVSQPTDGNVYNLQGQRVGDNYRGIVIRQGRKVKQ